MSQRPLRARKSAAQKSAAATRKASATAPAKRLRPSAAKPAKTITKVPPHGLAASAPQQGATRRQRAVVASRSVGPEQAPNSAAHTESGLSPPQPAGSSPHGKWHWKKWGAVATASLTLLTMDASNEHMVLWSGTRLAQRWVCPGSLPPAKTWLGLFENAGFSSSEAAQLTEVNARLLAAIEHGAYGADIAHRLLEDLGRQAETAPAGDHFQRSLALYALVVATLHVKGQREEALRVLASRGEYMSRSDALEPVLRLYEAALTGDEALILAGTRVQPGLEQALQAMAFPSVVATDGELRSPASMCQRLLATFALRRLAAAGQTIRVLAGAKHRHERGAELSARHHKPPEIPAGMLVTDDSGNLSEGAGGRLYFRHSQDRSVLTDYLGESLGLPVDAQAATLGDYTVPGEVQRLFDDPHVAVVVLLKEEV
jgi:hypothetical protein